VADRQGAANMELTMAHLPQGTLSTPRVDWTALFGRRLRRLAKQRVYSCWGMSSAIWTQGAFDRTKMCAVTATPGSVSNVPRRRRSRSGLSAYRFSRGEPQRVQKRRNWPGEDSNSPTRLSPDRKRNASAEREALVVNEAPEAFRHWTQ